MVEREGAPFIQLYQGALSNPVGVVDALKERWVAALLAENGVSEDVIALTARPDSAVRRCRWGRCGFPALPRASSS